MSALQRVNRSRLSLIRGGKLGRLGESGEDTSQQDLAREQQTQGQALVSSGAAVEKVITPASEGSGENPSYTPAVTGFFNPSTGEQAHWSGGAWIFPSEQNLVAVVRDTFQGDAPTQAVTVLEPESPANSQRAFDAVLQNPASTEFDKAQAIEARYGIEALAYVAGQGNFFSPGFATELGPYIAQRQDRASSAGFEIGQWKVGLTPVFLGVGAAAYAVAAGAGAGAAGGASAAGTNAAQTAALIEAGTVGFEGAALEAAALQSAFSAPAAAAAIESGTVGYEGAALEAGILGDSVPWLAEEAAAASAIESGTAGVEGAALESSALGYDVAAPVVTASDAQAAMIESGSVGYEGAALEQAVLGDSVPWLVEEAATQAALIESGTVGVEGAALESAALGFDAAGATAGFVLPSVTTGEALTAAALANALQSAGNTAVEVAGAGSGFPGLNEIFSGFPDIPLTDLQGLLDKLAPHLQDQLMKALALRPPVSPAGAAPRLSAGFGGEAGASPIAKIVAALALGAMVAIPLRGKMPRGKVRATTRRRRRVH